VTSWLSVSGSHEDVGRQVGHACRDAIRKATTITPEQLPAGRSLREQLAVAEPYRAATEEAFPWILVELDAAADAAGVDRNLLFAVAVEEIWPGRDTTALVATPAFRGCTDIVAGPPASANGRTLVGHNNDLPAGTQEDVRAIEWRVDGAPVVFSLGVGPFLSCAWNDAGLNITGNELAPNDERVGVPRLLLMSAISRARTVAEAQELAGHPGRASSYNWVLADAEGNAVSLEGSATAMAELGLDDRGVLHHENHYVAPSMLRYERSAANADRSAVRQHRVDELLRDLEPGTVTVAQLRTILSDHSNAPESICRHAVSDNDMATVFWAIADPAAGHVDYGIGAPCSSEFLRYSFN
jgi:isopenicillin-N N-acyltransferase-like protein